MRAGRRGVRDGHGAGAGQERGAGDGVGPGRGAGEDGERDAREQSVLRGPQHSRERDVAPRGGAGAGGGGAGPFCDSVAVSAGVLREERGEHSEGGAAGAVREGGGGVDDADA
eukprot:2352595-Rhodomonas_salina.1